MGQVMEFLQANRVFYLATTDGTAAHVRPLGFVMEWEGRLAFCTSNQKDMYRQMLAHPQVEICCMDEQMNTLRIAGKAVFCTSAESQRRALEVMPGLSRLYAVGDGKFEIFCIEGGRAVCATMRGETTQLPL